MEGKKLSLKDIGYKRLIILFLAGAALVFFSIYDFSDNSKENNKDTAETAVPETGHSGGTGFSGEEYIDYYEGKLKSILSCIKGIDEAEVMITLEAGAESIVLKDTPYTDERLEETDGGGGTRKSTSLTAEESTVMAEGGGNGSEPYVTKELAPKVAGVLIVAKGTITSKISLEIVGAVEALFNIPAHKIHILEKE